MNIKIIFLFVSCVTVILHAHINEEQNIIGAKTKVLVEISYGELIDKITILRIKKEHAQKQEQQTNIDFELSLLQKVLESRVHLSQDLMHLMQKLSAINQKLWKFEDIIRKKGAQREFDQEFIQVACSIYEYNDQRAFIKRTINELLGSEIIEEKIYTYKSHEF